MLWNRTGRVFTAATITALALTALAAAPASIADDGHGHGRSGHALVRVDLVGSMPAPASPVIAGINPGSVPWVIKASTARVREDGRIRVEIRGLVIPPPVGMGTNPIASVVATLVCDDAVQDSTAPFALSKAGNGSTRDTIWVPRYCEDGTVLIQPAGNRAVYIASGMEREGHEHD